MVVPTRLREAAGRREFVQSTRTHELAIAKLVGAVLQADWRAQLLRLESRSMSVDVLNLVEGAPALSGGGFLPLGDAVRLSGIAQAELLRACAARRISLFCRLGRVPGYLVPASSLEPINPEEGRSGGLDVPSPKHMPSGAVATTIGGMLRVVDSDYVAGVVLAETLDAVELVVLEAPNRPGWFFVPNVVVRRDVVALEVPAAEVEAMRLLMAAAVSPERLEHARAARKAKTESRAGAGGKWAEKLFSDAVAEYCSRSDGLPESLASDQEQSQRKKGLLLFSEFMGDLQLREIDSDKLREFREGRSGSVCLNNKPRFISGLQAVHKRCRVVHGGGGRL